MDKSVIEVFSEQLLQGATYMCEEVKDEEFAIKMLDVLLDKMWTKEEIIDVINETLEDDPVIEEPEDMNANDDEHRRQFERDVL